ncbi:PREDICTED: disease resistance protein RPM1-like, partial [Tarenaya hassleriana]|uniref:disease resistance protein RPM1-like n=1 Tax=Tarenaya hassleriana TaxID=28532 RepID=UPI00053C4646
VGMGGSGKTTLVGNIFRSQRVRRHFDSYSWVTISQSYDIEDVFRTMIKDFSKEQGLQVPSDLSSMRYRELVEMLVNYLQPKRYFIVLDDVWNTGFWKEISVAIPDGIHGSRVMITTREERIAHFSYGTMNRFHRIEPLKEDKAWELFRKRAFSGSPEQHIAPNIEPIARNLVQKCGGLPLALVALGSMMSTRRLESEWRRVYNSLNWELSNNPDLKDVQRILILSFNDLPYPLKHCFLYCCIFPEDYIIKRKKLIRLWMAQGFVQPTRGVKPEEVADSYIMELVYRNMFQVVFRNHNGRPKAFKMHDMVREISLMISRDEKFCDVFNDKAEDVQDGETRHLCIQREISSSIAQRNLQTLLVYSTTKQKVALPTALKLLRALDLEDSRIRKLPDSLATLFNLKYLNLTGTRVRKLPKSFRRLLNLETLNTKFSKIKELPTGISKLENLRYLVTFSHSNSDWSIVSGTKVSSDICQLKRLQVMDCIHAENELIRNLGDMTQLTRIGLVNVRKHHGHDLCNALNKMKDLRFVSLWSIDENEPLQLDALSPATTIEKLFLSGKLERLPSWFNTLHNLTELCLRWSRLAQDAIPCIQALPYLVWLSFFNAYEGDKLCFPEGFQSLKILLIGDMPRLNEIVIQEGAMPSLQKLHIKDCVMIKSLPSGIENLTKLQELRLRNVSDKLVESIREEQSKDCSKVNHIPTIKHYFITENGVSCENLS